MAVAAAAGLAVSVGVAVMASDARSSSAGAGEATDWGKQMKSDSDRRHRAKIEANGNKVDSGLER
jgi:hypothetical protein